MRHARPNKRRKAPAAHLGDIWGNPMPMVSRRRVRAPFDGVEAIKSMLAGLGYFAFVGVVIFVAFMLAMLAASRPSRSEWKPQYAQAPQWVRDWYSNAELTEAAKERFPFKKCCDHADVVKTRFSVNKTSHGDEWFWLDGETWKRVPPDVIHWGKSAPSGLPTLFVYSGKETCFFPGDGGI